MDTRELLTRGCKGAMAGTKATGPMTVVMETLRRTMPGARRDPFVPREVAEGIARQIGLSEALDRLGEPAWWTLTAASHIGYGAAAGSVYGLIDAGAHSDAADGSSPARVRACGAAFGLAVWAVSYIGLLPALGITKPLTDRPVRKHVAMIVSHVVWGVATAICYRRGQTSDRRTAALRSIRSQVATAPGSRRAVSTVS